MAQHIGVCVKQQDMDRFLSSFIKMKRVKQQDYEIKGIQNVTMLRDTEYHIILHCT